MIALQDKPLAAHGLTSYRLKGRYGWVMIGATDDADAMREAARSTDNPDAMSLEVWNGRAYEPATIAKDQAREEKLRDQIANGQDIDEVDCG